MSLQVWLPLTKDTKNQGLATGTIDWTTTASFTNNGKLGKALTTGGCKMPASMTAQVLNNQAVTIACWLYVNADADDTTNRAMIFGNDTMSSLGGRQFSIFRYPNSDDIHLSWQNAANGSTILGGVWSGVLTPHAWNHICITYQNPDVKIYVNGVQVGSNSGVMNASSFAYDTEIIHSSTSHYINDFRIYDHCLSLMEVKELSKGLILHYPLNRQGWGQENLFIDSTYEQADSSIANSSTDWSAYFRRYNGSAGIHSFSDYTDTITLSTTGNLGVTFQRKATDINLDSTLYYTISCEAKSTQIARPLCIGLSYYNNSNSWVWRGGSNPAYFEEVNKWQKFTLTFKPDADTQYIDYCFTVAGVANGTDTFSIRHCKLEEGSVATPWCPNSADALATTMGLNFTTEYDCSGFCNNGTKTGTFSWTSDTPKYSVSQYLNGSSYIKTLPGEFPWSNYDNLTIAAWMKPTVTPGGWTGSIGVAHDGGAGNKIFSISNYGGKFTVHTANGNYVSTQSDYVCPLNEWHHYVATLNGTTVNMYVDGVLNKTYTVSWGTATNHANPQIEVGVDLPGSDEIYKGYYSDVRIYATTLSANDIKSLYQNSAYVDNEGNVYGAVFEEV